MERLKLDTSEIRLLSSTRFREEFNLPKHYTVSDGELVLFLWPAEEGG
jgi:hypothetical protein